MRQEQRQGDVNVAPALRGTSGYRRNRMAGQCPMTSLTSALPLTPGAIHPEHIPELPVTGTPTRRPVLGFLALTVEVFLPAGVASF